MLTKPSENAQKTPILLVITCNLPSLFPIMQLFRTCAKVMLGAVRKASIILQNAPRSEFIAPKACLKALLVRCMKLGNEVDLIE